MGDIFKHSKQQADKSRKLMRDKPITPERCLLLAVYRNAGPCVHQLMQFASYYEEACELGKAAQVRYWEAEIRKYLLRGVGGQPQGSGQP